MSVGLDGEIDFNFFSNARYTIRVDRVEARSSTRASWFGDVLGVEGGRAIVVRHDEAWIANIWAGASGSFQIRPAGDGIYYVQQLDDALFPGCGCGEGQTEPPANPGFNPGASDQNRSDGEDELWGGGERRNGLNGGSDGPGDDGSLFDVAVFYTPEATAAAGGASEIQAIVQASIDVTNDAYANSQIVPRLRLVHSAETLQNETGDMASQLGALRDQGDGLYDEVHSLRDQYAADMVALLCTDGSFCGIAYLMTNLSNGFASNAFSVSNLGCAVGNRTFPHELGHNEGCAHDRNNAGSAVFPFSYGWRWFGNSGDQFRTVMAYSPGARVGHFSNPNVTFDGVATGVANSEDNARSINDAALHHCELACECANAPV